MTATIDAASSSFSSTASAKSATPHIAAVAVEKTYRKGENQVPVLRGVHLSVARGELLSIVGQSGSGKSTLMHLMGLLDSPDVGEIYLDGDRIDDLPVRSRDELRNRVFGFIFQFYHLLPELTALETRVEDLAGHGTNTHCTVLPVLLGGRVLEEIDVDGEFRIRVEAARDLVVVSFRELTEPAGLTLAIETEELRTSYAETIAVETQNGRHFSVQLSGGCEP